MTNNKAPSDRLRWQQMPLLRTLVLAQISIAVFFSIVAMLVAIYFINERSQSIQNARKLDLVRMMSINQEKIRIWANLGMSEASNLALAETRKIEYVENVFVKKLKKDQFFAFKMDMNTLVIPEEIDNSLPYYIVFNLRSSSSYSIVNALIIPLIVLLLIFALIYSSILFIMKKIFRPLSLLISDELESTKLNGMINIEASGEMKVLISKIQKNQLLKIQLESEKINFKLATQLAHDIRSPLEVLKSLKEEMAHFPDSTRKRINLSINRIEEITFNLLKSHKEAHGITGNITSENILGILTSTLAEKNIEYRYYDNVVFRDNFSSSAYEFFSEIDRPILKSILSNLINNAVESLDNKAGFVELLLLDDDDKCLIKIKDNGPGIPENIAKNLFTKGYTTKKDGNGLGLFNAKQDIEAVGGTLTFTTEVGVGTTFTITLPKSEAPPTFIDSIKAYKYERIIVLDDDPAFHEVWSKKLEGLEDKIEHIFSVEEMLSKYQELNSKILLLSDFELMDKELDGIDTILKLNHASNSILVTARSEELDIQERCLKNGIKLLPKILVNYIRVEFQGKDVVLIDDDRLMHINWSSYCAKNGISFKGFKSIEEFLKESDNINKEARIYIDSNLGNGIKGEVESEKIYLLGFKNLFLATGYEPQDIKAPNWIKKVYSKSPENIS